MMMISSASRQLLKPTDTQTLSTHLRSFKHSFLNLIKPSVHAHASVLAHKLQFVHDEPALAHAATASTQAQAQVVSQVAQVAPNDAQVAHYKVSTWKMKAAVILVAVLSFTVFTTVNADPAAAQAAGKVDTSDLTNTTSKVTAGANVKAILESDIGKIIRQLAQLFGLFLIFATLTMQTYKVYRSGAGFASALPTIVGAFLIGGVLFNLQLLASMIDFSSEFVSKLFSSVANILPGVGGST